MTDEIVGHKTYVESGEFRHEPLYKSEADNILKIIEESEKRRIELMPDENSAIKMLFDAYHRLKELGWNDSCYCPKDGSEFLAIEIGSTGQHKCTYNGEWPSGHFILGDELDQCVSHPVLFKAAKS